MKNLKVKIGMGICGAAMLTNIGCSKMIVLGEEKPLQSYSIVIPKNCEPELESETPFNDRMKRLKYVCEYKANKE